jgi:hypothetical protein
MKCKIAALKCGDGGMGGDLQAAGFSGCDTGLFISTSPMGRIIVIDRCETAQNPGYGSNLPLYH